MLTDSMVYGKMSSSVIDPVLWFFATRRKIRRHRLRATTAVRVTHDLRFFYGRVS